MDPFFSSEDSGSRIQIRIKIKIKWILNTALKDISDFDRYNKDMVDVSTLKIVIYGLKFDVGIPILRYWSYGIQVKKIDSLTKIFILFSNMTGEDGFFKEKELEVMEKKVVEVEKWMEEKVGDLVGG